jgi:hypothetical protein
VNVCNRGGLRKGVKALDLFAWLAVNGDYKFVCTSIQSHFFLHTFRTNGLGTYYLGYSYMTT